MSPFYYHTRITYSQVDSDLRLTLRAAMDIMQEASALHSAESGYSVSNVDSTHVAWILTQWRVEMPGEARWNEEITVQTWPRTMEKLTSIRCFQINNARGELIARAESVWVLVDAATGRIQRITPEVASAYDLIDRPVFPDPMPELPVQPGERVMEIHIMKRDIDSNRHVNNLVYLDYAQEALPQELDGVKFREVWIRYRRQLRRGDTAFCHYRRDGVSHIVDICGETPGDDRCTVIFLE